MPFYILVVNCICDHLIDSIQEVEMKTQKVLLSAAISGALALSSMPLSTTVNADEKEKCYGVAKAWKRLCNIQFVVRWHIHDG